MRAPATTPGPLPLTRAARLPRSYLDSFNELKAKTGNRNDAFAFAGYHPSRECVCVTPRVRG